MKVGIISMQKVQNFGSFLQAYSLKNTIESLGHTCEFIDIKPGEKIISKEKNSKINYLSKFDRYFVRRIRHYFFSKKRNIDFRTIYFKWLGLDESTNWDKHFDVVVIGSDEVFNCLQSKGWGLSPNLFGGGINAEKIISYAASCGHTTYNQVKKLGLEKRISSLLMNIEGFSVRDENTADFVKKLTGKEPLYHLDPVFIYNFQNELPKIKIKYNYIIIYSYDGRIKSEKEINSIQLFAKKNNLKIISAGLYQSWCDKNISASPFELLSYVRNAKYVVTDTFHGTVFSIKYNKQFATLIRCSNKQKLSDLLMRFGLESRKVLNVDFLSDILEQKIDYEPINNFIYKQNENSISYLNDNINNYNERI